MTIKLDGVEVAHGQNVYDVSSSRGHGKVTHIDDYHIEVGFGHRTVTYDPGGVAVHSKERTLYHSKPLIVPMTGDSNRDRVIRSLVGAVIKEIG